MLSLGTSPKSAVIDHLMRTDLLGVIATWNGGARRLYGYTSREAIGLSENILTQTDIPDEMQKFIDTIGRGEAMAHYKTIRRSIFTHVS